MQSDATGQRLTKKQQYYQDNKERIKVYANRYYRTHGNSEDSNRKRLAKARERKRVEVEKRGGKCFDCKILFEDYHFDFHHLIPEEKSFHISFNAQWDRLQSELKKCVMLCAHCHRTRHFKERNKDYESTTALD
jgi:hypothetical protein